MNEVEKAYLAGIIDGEGYVAINKINTKRSGTHYISALKIAMTELKILKWILDVTKVGNIDTYSRKNKNHKRVYRWTAYADNGASVLKAVLPYIKLKRRQSENLIVFQGTMHRGRSRKCTQKEIKTRDDLFKSQKKLNKRGT